MFRRVTASVVLGLAIAAGSAGIVSAHECYIASRSEQGNIGAGTHSKAWFAVSPAEVFAFVAQAEGGTMLSDDQLAWAIAAAKDAGLPQTLTLFGNHTLAEGTPAMDRNGHATDGKGVDHVFDGIWFDYVAIYHEALTK